MSRNEFAAHVKRTQVHLLLLLAGWLAAGSSLAQTTVEYIHTDALGSVVAVTNEAGQVIERFDYEPYGAIIGQPNYGGVGFTGHVQDAATGLTCMQQRYYDPICGCFLSVDPVAAYDTGDWRHFNRYAYAFNNPYTFTDPDGRCPGCTLNPHAIARMAPAAQVQTANRQAQQALGQAARGVAQKFAKDVKADQGTLQVGFTVNSTAGPLATTATADVAVDRQGNVAL